MSLGTLSGFLGDAESFPGLWDELERAYSLVTLVLPLEEFHSWLVRPCLGQHVKTTGIEAVLENQEEQAPFFLVLHSSIPNNSLLVMRNPRPPARPGWSLLHCGLCMVPAAPSRIREPRSDCSGSVWHKLLLSPLRCLAEVFLPFLLKGWKGGSLESWEDCKWGEVSRPRGD